MRNAHRPTTVIKRATPASDEGWLATWMGWEDVRGGRPYDALYERLEQAQQLNYERGRALAASVRGRIGSVPKWPTDVDLGSFMYSAVPYRDFLEMAVELEHFAA